MAFYLLFWATLPKWCVLLNKKKKKQGRKDFAPELLCRPFDVSSYLACWEMNVEVNVT